MTPEPPSVLEFPAWLDGPIAAIRRKARAEGRWWAREYLKTGAFPQPRQMRQVPPGEVLVMHSCLGEHHRSRRPRHLGPAAPCLVLCKALSKPPTVSLVNA
jgi:hypothetical protein